ncbi:MAG: acyltransferase [Coriobacteriia bacterium]|nr:acyltransferase [Coriobacteriia bacterium]
MTEGMHTNPVAAEGAAAPVRASGGRNDVIDALKYVAIALVILGHLLLLRGEFNDLSPDMLRIIVSMNMPLFTMLSGWVLFGREGRDPLLFMRGKVLGLLVPYLAWILLELPKRHVPLAAYPLRLWRALLNPAYGMQMWFLWALFMMFAVFTVARLVSRNDLWTAGVALAIAAVTFFVPRGMDGLARVVWLYPYFVLGYLAAKHRAKLRRFDAPVTVAAAVAFAGLSWANLAGPPPLEFATGITGAVAACGIFRFLPAAIPGAIGPLGSKTLGVYGGQMILMPFLILGSGWSGAMISWSAVLAGSTVLAVALDRFAVTRALFLGQWPRAWRGGRTR